MGSAASCWDPLYLTNLKQALKYFKILSQRKSTYLKIVWLITHSYIHVMCFGANTEWNWIENDVLNKCLILFLFFVSKLKRQQHSIKWPVGQIVIPEEVAVVTVWYYGKNPHIILNHCYNRIWTSTFQYCLCGQCSSSSVRFYESPQIKVSNWNVKFIGLDGRKNPRRDICVEVFWNQTLRLKIQRWAARCALKYDGKLKKRVIREYWHKKQKQMITLSTRVLFKNRIIILSP